MADSPKVNYLINQVNDPATRSALHMIFNQLKDDLEVNRQAFNGHTHQYDSSTNATGATSEPQSDAPTDGNSVGTEVTFSQNLK